MNRVANSLERQVCVTADYGLNGARNLTIFDTERLYTPDGALFQSHYSAVQNGLVEGIFSFPDYPFTSEYWVLHVGPRFYLKDALCSPCYEVYIRLHARVASDAIIAVGHCVGPGEPRALCAGAQRGHVL